MPHAIPLQRCERAWLISCQPSACEAIQMPTNRHPAIKYISSFLPARLTMRHLPSRPIRSLQNPHQACERCTNYFPSTEHKLQAAPNRIAINLKILFQPEIKIFGIGKFQASEKERQARIFHTPRLIPSCSSIQYLFTRNNPITRHAAPRSRYAERYFRLSSPLDLGWQWPGEPDLPPMKRKAGNTTG